MLISEITKVDEVRIVQFVSNTRIGYQLGGFNRFGR